MLTMHQYIERENIARFMGNLSTEPGPAKRLSCLNY